MLILLIFSFISGLVTIFALCIWLLLPIVFSASAAGGQKKPFGITLGIMLSFAAATLSISYLVKIFNFDPNFLRLFAVAVIGALGLTLVFPPLTRKLEAAVSMLAGKIKINPNSQSF